MKNNLAIVNPAIQSEVENETGEARDALSSFREFQILSKDDLDFAAQMLAEVKGNIKRLEERKQEITKPINDALKSIRALFKAPLDFYEECEAVLKGKLAQVHERAEQEKRAALLEAREAAREGDSEGTSEALAKLDEAAKFPEVDGVQYRSQWRFEITDPEAVPREYCAPDLKLIGAVVAHRKQATDIPGVRVYEETIVASKSA